MPDEFTRLLAPHKNAVERFVYYKLPTRTDGEDILQDVYFAAAQNLRQLRDPTRFKSWILAIAANRIRAFYARRARRQEIPHGDEFFAALPESRTGRGVMRTVHETLDKLPDSDRELLQMAYFHGLPLSEISRRLSVPVGTVKSRLFAARGRFRALYPFPPSVKGGTPMSKMPKNLPEITIRRTGEADSAFWTELMGWFIIPRIGEKASWAIYDYPARTRSEAYDLNCIRPARIHGVEGVEIEMQETLPDGTQPPFSLVAAQLTDTHCRYLAETTIVDGVRDVCTFLDDAFTARLAIGEDNCGTEIHLFRKDAIIPAENGYACAETKPVFDVTGRFEVTVGTRTFETVRITYIETDADGTILCEYYVDANGRCVLDRRFNADDWKISYYKKNWREKLPENEVICVNGAPFVHWYSCISDYVL